MKLLTHSALHRSGAATACLAAAGLALAGCGTSGPAAGASGTSSGSPAASTGTTSGSGGSGSGGSGSGGSATTTSSNAVPFPVGVGDTWVYRSATETGTSTRVVNKILAVTPVSGGQQVKMQDTINGNNSTAIYYIFHSDGSITYPFNQLGNDIKVLKGTIEWPSKAAIDSGQVTTSTVVMQINEGTQKSDVTSHVTVKGDGTTSVTVPAGTYTATIVEMNETYTVLGHTGKITVKTYLADNVGPVESKVIIKIGGISSIVSDQKLVSFTKG